MANWSHRKKGFVYRMTGGKCWYCGKDANSIDHMIPASRGGSNAYGNVVPACRSCNSNKSDMTVSEFRLRKSKEHKFWGELNNCDPNWPLRCMGWRGSFGVLHEADDNWIVSLKNWVRRKSRKRFSKLKRKLRKYWRLYGIASWRKRLLLETR